MPGTTSKRPSSISSWPCRHRLGFAVSGRVGAAQEGIGVEVPHHAARPSAVICRSLAAADEPAGGVLEVLPVVHRQRGRHVAIAARVTSVARPFVHRGVAPGDDGGGMTVISATSDRLGLHLSTPKGQHRIGRDDEPPPPSPRRPPAYDATS